jgi:hypothetical protein
MMKKVYAMAWKYMNYDANDFLRTIGNHGSSSWNIGSKVRVLSQAMLNQPRQCTQIQDRRRCLGRVR